VGEGYCPKGVCDGSGWILDEETSEARACECRAIRIREGRRRLGTGIPKRFLGVGFDRKPVADMDPGIVLHVKDFVRKIDWNLEAGKGLWFYGDVGTGKTSLAMIVSKAAIDSGRDVAVYSVPHLLADIRSTYEDGSGSTYLELFRRLANVHLLHLDDLGAEKPTEWVLEQLYSIVNERWQNQRSIVVTTNIDDRDELREQVGNRTVSRLTEICGDPLPIMGRDLRVPKSA